jgi:hypothetical protein
MIPASRALAVLIASSFILSDARSAKLDPITMYRGICDASAAVALGQDHFVVGDDELNVLRVYRRGEPVFVAQSEVFRFLGTKPDKESDIEGAAKVGNRIFWISSHGTNNKGEVQDRRRRLFATEIVENGDTPNVRPVGVPYSGLVEDLVGDPRLRKYGLAEAATKPPKTAGALNIEGLAEAAEEGLLIGFRNPVPAGKALLVPLTNPHELISDANGVAKFGDPIEIDLGGRGIRSIERIGESYLIVAGPIAGHDKSDLYRWSGKANEDPTMVPGIDLSGLNPEALFAVPGTEQVQILSDDGDVQIAGMSCKDAPPAFQAFRSITIRP